MKQNNKSPAPFAITEEKQTIETMLNLVKHQTQQLKDQQLQQNNEIKLLSKAFRDQNQSILQSQNQEYFNLTSKLIEEIESDNYFQIKLNQIQAYNKQLFNLIKDVQKEIPSQYQQLSIINRVINFYKCIFRISIKQLNKDEVAIIFHQTLGNMDYGHPIIIQLKDSKQQQRQQFWNQFTSLI
ncbi:unnamed protein product [Paramecium pentaurelia]|uniref:Uncharacterized protein n=1 Tax=Paramecium pentaurelia TaxID=43138 RepID=A0A8S1SIM1_9CILI|nr:unnamed protein product [Paramecium pentaurelia]